MKVRLSIVGIGYVGLSTAVGFALRNYPVYALTHDPNKVRKINQGEPPFHEPNLQEKLGEVVNAKLLECTSAIEDGILNTDLTFIATGTPSRPDGSIELKYIKESAKEIGRAIRKKEKYHLAVVKSTVVPGTTERVLKPIIEKTSGKKCGENFGLCMNPEFLRQGSALHDTLNPDRVVIGGFDECSGETLVNFYKDFYGSDTPILQTSLSTAEMIKYASNAFLATKISFINTIANICERVPNVDVVKVAEAMGFDKRIGMAFLKAGVGYGGSCFPKDVKALIAFSKELGYDPLILQSIETVNKAQPERIVQLCKNVLNSLDGKTIAILGLAFKPETDDMREARVIPIINLLLQEGAEVAAYDPVAMPTARTIFKEKIRYAASAIGCLKNAECCILVTEWDEFKRLKPEDFRKNMKKPVLIDGRRIYDPEEFSEKTLFKAIGLGNKHQKLHEDIA
jgi:UDPglucose 6-dehydrogenase